MNLATSGKAGQSRAFRGNNANKVIDGDTGEKWSDYSCIKSLRKKYVWWRVDFTQRIEVNAVGIVRGKLHTVNISYRLHICMLDFTVYIH